jgi:hypothetical protein
LTCTVSTTEPLAALMTIVARGGSGVNPTGTIE